MIADAAGSAIQVTHYYPFGMSFTEGFEQDIKPAKQLYKYNGKELDGENSLNWYDYEARQLAMDVSRFTRIDPHAEKYYSISPYAYVMNNPINAIDMNGDSITFVGENISEIINALFHGLEEGESISLRFNENGVLDPSSIEEQAKNSSDFFLKDLYEIAVNPAMVELSLSTKNTYMKDGEIKKPEFKRPYDYNTSEDPQAEALGIIAGMPVGKGIQGNLGQTLIPGNVSESGKSSTSMNVQVIINSKGTLNHRTVGLVHEFAHVILYLRNKPYGHTQSGVDAFVYSRVTAMSKRLGYDF